MSSNKSKLSGRKATFTSEVVKGKRVFTAVNKRAHAVCRKNGKKSKLGVSELKSSVRKGTYKFYVWNNGVLKPVKF